MVCLFTAALLQINIQAQTLLYHWNFDNTTGSVSTLTTPPAYVDTADGYTGGTFGVALNASSQLSMPAGSGLSNAWSNAPADLAWTCTTAYSAAGPIYQAGVGGLNQIANSFTVTLWMKYNATVTSFSALNCRLLNISSGPAQDGYELYFSMNSGNLIQVGVDNSGTGPTSGNAFGSLGASPQTMTNQWFFVAITYTNSSSGTVNIYTGTANSPASLVATLTGVAPGTAGAINWSSITNYMDVGNSWKDNDGDRTFPGSIDNVRIFNGAGNLQFIDNVQAADQGTGVLPGPPGKNVTWMGNISANWNTNTFNWTSSAVETNYANGDVVLFNDSAIVTTVKVGTNISPGSVTVSNNTLAYVLSGIGGIGGTGGLTKQGTNTLTLSGTNTYSGTTTVSNGTLLVNGNNLGAGPVSVNAHGILCGVGTIAGAVTIQSGGILAPGAGAGTAAALTLSNSLTLVSDSFTSFRVQTGGIKDQIVSGGTVTYGGTLTVTNVGSFPLVAGDTFKLFTAADYSGSFAAIKLPALMDNLVWINTLANNGTLSVAALTAPVVTNLPATGVQGSLATLNGKVVSTGNQTPTVTLYYGPADGGANAAAWSNSVVLGSQDGSFSYLATGLSTNMTYYYAARAANGVGIVWATPSQSFTTLAADPSSAPTLVQYLSGTDKDHTVPWQFSVSSGNNAGIATNLPVPSCWPCQGFGTFSYTQNTGPGMTRADAETGYYTNTFSVPSAWAGKEIFLVFEGVLTDTSASINGHSVGPTHQGGYYEFRYDATPYVVVGANTNVLTVTVRKFSANASV
jgi:autotransporter-associated beta strand protein